MLDQQVTSNSGPVEALYERLIAYEKSRRQTISKGPGKGSAVVIAFRSLVGSVIFAFFFLWLGRMKTPDTFAYYLCAISATFFVLIWTVLGITAPTLLFIYIAPFLPEAWRNLKDPFRNLLKRKTTLDEEDFKLIAELRDNYSVETLKFLAKRLPLHATHTRDGYGMFIGTPSQLKVLLIVGTVVQLGLSQFFRDLVHRMTFLVVVFACAFFTLLVLALVDQPVSQRMEELAQILDLAADQKKDLKNQLDQVSVTAASLSARAS